MIRFDHPLRDFLRARRRDTGLSLEKFAARHGLTAVTYGSYERGDRNPSVTTLAVLLDRLGFDLVAVPKGAVVERTPADWAVELRELTRFLEERAA